MKQALEIKTVIAERYEIESVVERRIKSQINYLCVDLQSKSRVVLKEFYPEYAQRDVDGNVIFLSDYVSDLEKFKNRHFLVKKYSSLPTVLCVYDVIAYNNTCYAVCEHVKASTVENLVTDQGVFSFTAIQHTLKALLYTNKTLLSHGLCHKSFRPDNILITEDGYVKINEIFFNDASQESAAVKSLAALGYYMLSGVRMTVNGKFKRVKFSGNMKQMADYLIYLEYCPLATTVQDFLEVVKNKFAVKIPSRFKQWCNHLQNKKKLKTAGIFGGIAFALLLLVFIGILGVKSANTTARQLDTSAKISYSINGGDKVTSAVASQPILQLQPFSRTINAVIPSLPKTGIDKLLIYVEVQEGDALTVSGFSKGVFDGVESESSISPLVPPEGEAGTARIYEFDITNIIKNAESIDKVSVKISVSRSLLFGIVKPESIYEIHCTHNEIASIKGISYTVGTSVEKQALKNFDALNGDYTLDGFAVTEDTLTFYIDADEAYNVNVYADAAHKNEINANENGGYTVTLETELQALYIVVSGKSDTVDDFTYTVKFRKDGCPHCGVDHDPASCEKNPANKNQPEESSVKCSLCGSKKHKAANHTCSICGAKGHDEGKAHCATCKTTAHTTANHPQEKKKCANCSSTEHTTENHPKCAICSSPDHTDHPKCELCDSTEHTKANHTCGVCGEKGHDKERMHCPNCNSTAHTTLDFCPQY